MKIGLAQINVTLGAFQQNAEKIVQYIKRASSEGCDMVVFPEASLFGYHPVDLLERPSIVKEQIKYIKEISDQIPPEMGVFIGAITKNEKKNGKPYHNSAVFLQKGKSPRIFAKELLPTYDVFDEARHIESGRVERNIFRFKGVKMLVTICEDIWAWKLPKESANVRYSENPIQRVKEKNIDLIVNLSASPFTEYKLKQRQFVTESTAKKINAPMLYVNLIGAQDELIYDGGSFAIDKKGKVIAQAHRFKEDLVSFELNPKKKTVFSGQKRSITKDKIESKKSAILLGIRDFCEKVGIRKVHLGLSGGIDSAVVAALAVEALGPHSVTCIGMPSQFNKPESLESARKLAENLKCQWYEMPIGDLYNTELAMLEKTFGDIKFGVTNENLQARTRALLLMAYSNLKTSLLLNTSNKSELAMGYSTLYGDLCGALSPIGDLLKTEVFLVASLINSEKEIIPKFIIERPPSAELRPNQKDSDSLPQYVLLDEVVDKLIVKSKPPTGDIGRFVLNGLMQSEFKRWQAPPILKVSPHAFGRGRRLPIAHKAFF